MNLAVDTNTLSAKTDLVATNKTTQSGKVWTTAHTCATVTKSKPPTARYNNVS